MHSPFIDTREFVYVGFYVLLQFFLFCNVFRVPLALELIYVLPICWTLAHTPECASTTTETPRAAFVFRPFA